MEEMNSRLRQAADSLGVALDDDQVGKLLHFVQQMQRWNRTYNLTAIRDADSMLVHHVFDSLAIISSVHNAIQQLQAKRAGTADTVRLLDVGSGAGLPGVVLAICLPEFEVYCVDAVEKKVAFIRQMAAVLKLPGLKGEHARIEQMDSLQAHIIVSRAFASLTDFVTLSEKHLIADGYFLAMKGRPAPEELHQMESETEWRVEQIEPLQVPDLDAHRCLIWISHKGEA